ncbi:MAG: 3-deoxy-7-phosphoheptulonate synthase, partial [Candidatus Thiodiazotropha sp. (ex Lucinoma kastoroae)]|nr:3-deoxy-7-phosphoheptulonate synthase [Candidatus Thiodiazotropha sp. (ex Lucinoma kastoroae)]
GKNYSRQVIVWGNLIDQIRHARNANENQSLILGAMLESHLNAGRQDIVAESAELEYGVSVTDACIDWKTTEKLLLEGFEALG